MNRHWQTTVLSVSILAASLANLRGAAAQVSKADQQRIDAAIPERAMVKPIKPRKLLIFGLNIGYPGHGSIRYANYAFAQMGRRTGAFESVISNDPAMFRPDTLRQFDAVFFNNNVGNLFEQQELRQSLVDFIYSGGGMLGVHGTTVAFTRWPGAIEDWPEFGRMLGGRGANHKNSDEHVVIHLDDPSSPINTPFEGKRFDFRDEFFRVHGPYSRNRVRVLLSIDTERTDMTQGGYPRGQVDRPDNDYALAWIRSYGRGRVFYCTIAHNPYVFWDPKMLEFYLGAIQFALGDLPAPTTPSAKLTPAMRAQEQLGWQLELGPATERAGTLFKAIDLAARCQLPYLGASEAQQVSDSIAKPLRPGLNEDELRQIRLRLDDAGVRLLTYSIDEMPAQEETARQLLSFARRMGFEVILVSKPPESLERVAKLAADFDLRISLPDTPGTARLSKTTAPELHQWIGHDVDLASNMNSDAAVLDSPNHAFTCVMPQLPVTTGDGAAWSKANMQRQLTMFLQPLTGTASNPIVFRVCPARTTTDTCGALGPSIDLLNRVSLQLKER